MTERSSEPPPLAPSVRQQQPPQQLPTQLEFTQAMTDFRVMFPDMDAEVIEAVLRANQGAVDQTIDHLLSMSADNEAEKAVHGVCSDNSPTSTSRPSNQSQRPTGLICDNLADGDGDLIYLDSEGDDFPPTNQSVQPPESSPIDLLGDLDVNALSFSPLSSNPSQSGVLQRPYCTNPSSSSMPQHSYSHPKRMEAEAVAAEASSQEDVTLPPSSPSQGTRSIYPTQHQLQEIYEDNLRRREAARVACGIEGADASFKARAQILADERMALMLQNEEFMAELRRDREFMSSLEMDDRERSSAASTSGGGGRGGHCRPSSGALDEAAFREKLRTMGKTSMRKFSQLANMFSNRRSKVSGGGVKQLLGQAPAPSNDNLLLNAEPLVNEYDDESEDDNGGRNASKTPTKGKYTSLS